MIKENEVRKKRIPNSEYAAQIARLFKEKSCERITFRVYGYSMRPFIENGRDQVELVPPQKPQIGQVVFAEVAPKTYALHRIIRIDGNIITMRGDGNRLSQTESFTADKIIGTASAFIRKGKRIGTDSRKWRIYSRIWEFLKPIRRVLLAIYSRTSKIINL